MEYKFKIIVLGNYSSGKTSIVKRLKDESFYDTYSSTIGVDFIKKNYGILLILLFIVLLLCFRYKEVKKRRKRQNTINSES